MSDTIPGYLPAPTTGTQKCRRCSDWIVSGQSFGLNNTYPLCAHCFDYKTNHETPNIPLRPPHPPPDLCAG